jgi:tetratricopeptide (TPR) repeat protein/transcriptional regulator with XRE-family HTH domain
LAVAGQPASSFAGLLRQLRAEAGLTQEELAQAAGLGLRTVGDLERGAHRTAHQDTARLLADALGLAGPAHGLFVAAARGRVEAAEVLAARADVSAALAAMVTSAPGPPVVPVPRELPADVGAFTGRAVELAELDLLLPGAAERQAQPTGLVVISAVSGTAGVGKTALAVRWAHRAADAFPDGQLYVNLRGYDPDQPVPPGDALAGFLRALGVPDQAIPLNEAERAARYRSLVAGKQLLVVLDNAATVEQVRPLLPGTSSVMVVVTSRDALAGLVVRDGARRLDLDLLSPAEAVALLHSLIGARAETDPEAAERLAEQCARLPLALRIAAELAAARPETPLAELTAELADLQGRLELLDAGGDPRSAVAAVFSWSYRHLPEDAARMFRLLGLHPAQDWDPYAAAALIATASLPEAQRLLGVLARAHLVQHVGPGRHSMHDLLRAYAAQQATVHDTDQARQDALTRLFDYYLAASATAADHLFSFQFTSRPDPPLVSTPVPPFPDRATALTWLDIERVTLLAVAAFAASHGWPAHTTCLAAILGGYFYRARDTRALTLHSLALDAARAMGDSAAQGRALAGLGSLYWCQGRYQQSADLCQQAVALAHEAGDQRTQAMALVHLAVSYEYLGKAEEAFDSYRQAIARYRELGDRAAEAVVLINLGEDCFYSGRGQEGIGYIQKALTVGREIGDQFTISASLANLGEFDGVQGRYQEATDHLREALAVARQSGGHRSLEARAHDRLGAVCHRQGRYVLAIGHCEQALAINRELGDRGGEVEALNNLGATLLATGQPDEARACHTAALALARQISFARGEALSQKALGEVSYCQGNYDRAYGYYQQALARFREKDDLWSQAEALNGAGETLLATGQHEQARACLIAALTLAERTGYRYQQARAHRGLAAACHAAGQLERARQHRQHTLDIYTGLGVPEAAVMHAGPASPADTALAGTAEMPTTAAQ